MLPPGPRLADLLKTRMPKYRQIAGLLNLGLNLLSVGTARGEQWPVF